MCLSWFKRTPTPDPIPDPIPDPVPVVIFHRDFTGSKFDWSDWYLFTGKGMRGIYPDFINKVIWLKDYVVASAEGLQLLCGTGSAIKPDWKSDGYYTFDWFKGKFNFCGQICSYFCSTNQGTTLKPGDRLDVHMKVPPKGYLYFFALWLYNALKGNQQPEVDFEFFGSEAFPYRIVPNGKSDYMRFSLHSPDGKGGTKSQSTGHTFPIDLSLDYHTYSLDWQPTYMAWLVDGVEYFRVTENVPTDPMLFILGMQAGPAVPDGPAYNHVFTDAECGAKAIIKSIKISKLKV